MSFHVKGRRPPQVRKKLALFLFEISAGTAGIGIHANNTNKTCILELQNECIYRKYPWKFQAVRTVKL